MATDMTPTKDLKPVLVKTQSIATAVPQLSDGIGLADLVGAWIHIYALERINSETYGEGVRLHVREADQHGVELGDEFVIATFAYRFRAIARALLGAQEWVAIEPPIRGRVTKYPTAKGTGYDLTAE
jgi:hypothetical protein